MKMTNPEPLNGKYECYGQNLWWDKLAKQRLSTDASEVLEDMRLAVKGLLMNLNNFKREIEKKEIRCYGKEDKLKDKACLVDEKMLLNKVIDLIKFWLKDVYEGE